MALEVYNYIVALLANCANQPNQISVFGLLLIPHMRVANKRMRLKQRLVTLSDQHIDAGLRQMLVQMLEDCRCKNCISNESRLYDEYFFQGNFLCGHVVFTKSVVQ